MLKRWAGLPGGSRWLIAGIAAVVLAPAVAWVLFVPAADWLAHHDVGSANGALLQTARDAARGRLLTLGAGLFAAGALIFTAQNVRLSRRAVELSRRTFELAEQGHVTDRYTQAIKQLGGKKPDVRLGGIYALERVARDSARDHPAVLEVLTAFVREHAPISTRPSRPDLAQPERSPPADVQAALTVVGRLTMAGRGDPTRDIRPIDLSGAALAGAKLPHGAHLAGAKLAGVILSGVDLGGADLSGADLTGAILTGAVLGPVKLTDAELAEAELPRDARCVVTKLVGADLSGADLTGADLTGADLTGAKWPEGTPVPQGWKLDARSSRLERPSAGSG